jgi:hypothetical protein
MGHMNVYGIRVAFVQWRVLVDMAMNLWAA